MNVNSALQFAQNAEPTKMNEFWPLQTQAEPGVKALNLLLVLIDQARIA